MNPIHWVLGKNPERKTSTTSRHSAMSTGSELMASGTWEGLDQLPSKLTVDNNFKVAFRTSSICMSWGWSLFSSFRTYWQLLSIKKMGKLLVNLPRAIHVRTRWPLVQAAAGLVPGLWGREICCKQKGGQKEKRHTSNVQTNKTTTTKTTTS